MWAVDSSQTERFLGLFHVSDGCWPWRGYVSRDGYGRINFAAVGKPMLAHRVSYEHFIGEIPPGLSLDHLCRNRGCVNPEHLEPVTSAENTRRAAVLRTHCKRGHEYNEANTYSSARGRQCRVCVRERRTFFTGPHNSLKTHCPRGHAYTDENTYRRPGSGHRECRTCITARFRAARNG